MGNFLQLIYNELAKIYIRKSTLIMYSIIIVLIIGFGSLNKKFDDVPNAGAYGEDWREVLLAENEKLAEEQSEVDKKLAAYDKKHGEDNQDEDGWDEARFEIEMSAPDLKVVEENNVYLDNDTKPSGYGAAQFVVSNAGMILIVTLLTIIVAAGIIAYEFRWGTIKLLLIRPISRTKILFSKYVAVLLYGLFTTLFVIIIAWLVGALMFGVEGKGANMIVQSYGNMSSGELSMTLESTYQQMMTIYGYSLIELVMMATFAFMISAAFRNSTLAVGTTVFLTFAGTTITLFLLAFEKNIAKYLLFTHMDLSQYATGEVLLEGMTVGFSIIMLIIYYVLFMSVSWIAFVKRDVA